jgi:hypothetical protein
MATKKTAKKIPAAARAATAKDGLPAVKKAATRKAVPKVVPKAAAKPSPDVIARAAYLNYRRRVEQGLAGDSHADWLEAERYFSGKNES